METNRTPHTSREPCPNRIIDDAGGAFGMGAVGGGVFHFLKGMYNSPQGHRLIGGSQAVRMNAPRLGGSFAVWGGLFSTFDCALVYARNKEDPWNSVIAGAATGGLLSARKGLLAASRSALGGALILALVEGAGIMLNKVAQNMAVEIEDSIPNVAGGGVGLQVPNVSDQSDQTKTSSAWFGGWFEGKKEEAEGIKTEVLESFDSPVPPIFEFT